MNRKKRYAGIISSIISVSVIMNAMAPLACAEEGYGLSDPIVSYESEMPPAEESGIGEAYTERFDTVPSSITASVQNRNMVCGTIQQISVTSDTVQSPACTFSSNAPSVASVSDEGIIAAWSEGTAVITCKSVAGSAQASVTVSVISAEPVSVSPAAVLDGAGSSNISANNYAVWSRPVNSYLSENSDGTFTRAEYTGGSVIIEQYSKANALLSSKKISCELPIFGGAFSGKNYNFIVFGSNNASDSDDTEVMRVVKYSKSWQRLSSYSVYGANTYSPFSAGSLRMDEAGSRLYIHTCHEMYKTSDGYHHQANMTFVIDQNTMTEEQSWYGIMNASYGYVSHSFNQFVKTDGKNVYRVDHGDYYPRAVYLSKCAVGGSITGVSYGNILTIKEASGYHYNYTGVSVGGLELSTHNCMIAGNSIDQSESSGVSVMGQRNIFVISVKKDMSGKKTTWLTNYGENANITVRTPQLVKLTDEHFLVMWEEVNNSTGVKNVNIAAIDSSGDLISKETSDKYALSDCQPITTSYGTVKWYASEQTPYMYEYAPFAPDPAEAFVERLYVDLLGRSSDPKGKANHVSSIKSGRSACDVAKGFVLSTELANKKLTNKEFVTRMYKTFLNRTPDAGGLARWTAALDNGCSYGYVLQGFGKSAEFTRLCASYGITRGSYTSPEYRDKNEKLTAYVSRLYTVALGRKYDIKGLNNHTGRYINGTKTAEEIAYSFVFSAEFKNKKLTDEQFVDCMYNSLFGRTADAGGKSRWLTKMKNGMTREQVFKGFASSAEFKNMVAKFGL
ncbi:MAG: DUF4214 domain-containing protein [Huintestinicola sp.]|uniref:DUF4214 domain-containing protein n=1 Tax=Huintestinicola sp. TaxID=2981661 RepID=UPI003EFEA00F